MNRTMREGFSKMEARIDKMEVASEQRFAKMEARIDKLGTHLMVLAGIVVMTAAGTAVSVWAHK
jgi:hypothetical protein